MPWLTPLALVYALAFHMLSRLSKNSAQCYFLRRSILSMYKRRVSLTLALASAMSYPPRRAVVIWFRAAPNESRSVVSSSVQHRLASGDGLDLAPCSSKISLRVASSLSAVVSSSV